MPEPFGMECNYDSKESEREDVVIGAAATTPPDPPFEGGETKRGGSRR